MPSSNELFAQAVEAYRQDNLAEAERCCREVLRQEPQRAEAWNLLGAFYKRAGRLGEAKHCFKEAVKVDPENPPYHNNLGEVYRGEGALEEAEVCYRKAVELEPKYAVGHNNLALVMQSQGLFEEAADYLRKAIGLRPAYSRAHYNLGNVLREQEKLEEAASAFRKALELKPDYAAAHNALGGVRKAEENFEGAQSCFERALQINPNYAKANCNMGGLFLERNRVSEAIARFRKALAIDPSYFKAVCGLSAALNEEEQFGEAEQAMEEALRIEPDSVDALTQYAAILRAREERDKALGVLQRAVALEPANATTRLNLGNLLSESTDPAAALEHFEEAAKLDPDSTQAYVNRINLKANQCLWQDRKEEISRLRDMIKEADVEDHPGPLPPFAPLTFHFSQNEKLAIYRRWADRLSDKVAERRDWLANRKSGRTPGGPFDSAPFHSAQGRPHTVAEGDSEHEETVRRIGYLSSDFRNHATSHLMLGLFGLHDREEFEVFCFSFGPDDGSVYRKRIERDCDHFRDLRNRPYWAIAEAISRDGIDILMDLNGYAAGCRPKIVALRPAPLQISLLGYPGTMGAEFIDYLVADRSVNPPEMETSYSENLVLMPHCYQINDHEQQISERRFTRAECGLPEEGFVYCCFNSNYKIEPEIFDIWMRILKEVPQSVLWLYEGNPAAPENLRKEAAVRGIPGERLVFAQSLPKPEHLARHRLADLFLDTLICNAHTTASDALWAGLPVITCPGQTFESRVAASLLTAIGLPELIMPDLEAYEKTAIRLAKHPEVLQKLEEKLAINRLTTPLFDTPRWTRNWEKALKMIWERYERGEEPGEIVVEE